MNLEEINLGKKMVQALKMMDMSQVSLAAKLSIPVSTLNGYITGRYLPEYERLREIAVSIGVSSDFLLGVESETALSDDELWVVIRYRKLDDCKRNDIINYFNFLTTKK